MGPQRLWAEVRFLLGGRIEEQLPRVRTPTMLVRGARDAIAPSRWLKEAARLVGAARIVVIPGGGHAVHYSAAALLVSAITPFLRQVSQAAEQGGQAGLLSEAT
jgi:pimeloyl-ACP methyl ester carboxylesterase